MSRTRALQEVASRVPQSYVTHKRVERFALGRFESVRRSLNHPYRMPVLLQPHRKELRRLDVILDEEYGCAA